MKVIYNNKEVANTTLNYNELFNKPLLNSHELVGNTSLNDIGVYSKPQVDNLIASTRSIKVVSALPTPLVANTMYYVGPDANNLYHIYLVDSSLTLIDLGMSQDAVYLGGNGIDISSDNEISVVFDNETLMLNSEGELYVRSATQNVEGVVSYDNTTIKKNNSGKIHVPQLEGTKGSATKPVYLNDGQITASTGTVGATDRPVYLKAGTITQTSTPESGSWYKGVPLVSNSGVTEIGNYLDFHNSNTTTKDFNVRLYADMNAQTGLAIMGVKDNGTDLTGGYIPVITNNWEDVGSPIQPVYVNNGAITKTQSLFTVDGATNIPANSDLNTTAFTACGKYSCGSSSNAGTLTNCPSTSGFHMIVENVVGPDSVSLSNVGGWVSRTRTIESYYGDKWVQSIVKGGASDTTITYGAWRRVLDSGAVSLRHLTGVTRNTTYINGGTVDFWVDHATCVASGYFTLSQDVPAQTVLYTLPSGYTIADNTYGFIFGSAGGFKLAKARYNQDTIIADSAITANSSETKFISLTFMLSKYPA